MKAKITFDTNKNLHIVWVLKVRNTGIKCLDFKKQWLIDRAFFNVNDATKYVNLLNNL